MNNDSIVMDWKNITDPVLRKKERKKAWRKNNREKVSISSKKYYKANKEKRKAYYKKYYYENPDKILAYRQLNKEEIKISSKSYYHNNKEKNKEKIKARHKKYYETNKDKIKAYFKKNRDILNEYDKNRVKTNVQYKLKKRLRCRLYYAVKGNQKTGSAISDLGCSIDELKIYLESKFQLGMTWDNWGFEGWHIDHIKPLSSFDLTDRNQFLQACHYTNLQPLWAKDNISKSDKIL